MVSEIRYNQIAERRRRLKAAGCCITCGKPAVNANYCEEHRQWHLRYQREYHRMHPAKRQQQSREGWIRRRLKHPTICKVCQKPIDPRTDPNRRKYHIACAEIVKTVNKLCKVYPSTSESHRKAVRRYQARHRTLGLCVQCPRPAVKPAERCELHLATGERKFYADPKSKQTNAEKQTARTPRRRRSRNS